MQYSGKGGFLGTNAGDQGTVFSFLCGHGQPGAAVVGVFEVRQGVLAFSCGFVRGFDERGDGDFSSIDYSVG